MNDPPLTIAYLTAGAGGMYCGSCLHDNTLVRALQKSGVDALLVPTYTPIRTDEENVSVDRVFFGGINVYLQQKLPLFRHLPALFDRMFDQPWLIRWVTSRGMETSAAELGGLTVSMLQGSSGFQRKEVRKLCSWLAHSHKPHLIVLSNILIAGCVPELKNQLDVPILVTLQGDDIFLDDLTEPFRSRAFEEIRRLVENVDGFLTYSRYYADHMSEYFSIPREKFHIVPLGLDTADFQSFIEETAPPAERPPTVGFLARLCKEKGLHVLVDAFIELKKRPGMQDARLRMAGWLGENNRAYVDEQMEKLRAAGLADSVQCDGTIDRQAKVKFLAEVDVLTVPTIYREPKGLFVLESLAAGVPVVQPDHGAFPELLAATGGGRLVRPNDPSHLADELADLLADSPARLQLGRAGQSAVHAHFHADAMANATLQVFRQFL